jgi:hypothetical protein
MELSFTISASPPILLCYGSHVASPVDEHSAHCRACKERVRELLTAIYGQCRVNYSFPWSARPEDYASTPIGSLLRQIRTALGDLRGHRDFIKSAQVPPCDYFLTDPLFILEFDESQHFSRPRLVALHNYPENTPIGFSISRWRDFCREIDAKDDEPFDRDERRAWYDTLRDFVPTLHGFKPTVRVHAEEFPWCSLDAGSAHGLERFWTLLQGRLPDRTR